jgi:hypothetical protein
MEYLLTPFEEHDIIIYRIAATSSVFGEMSGGRRREAGRQLNGGRASEGRARAVFPGCRSVMYSLHSFSPRK